MDPYGWFAFGMIVGIGTATLLITFMDALDRRLGWVEALVQKIDDWLASVEGEK